MKVLALPDTVLTITVYDQRHHFKVKGCKHSLGSSKLVHPRSWMDSSLVPHILSPGPVFVSPSVFISAGIYLRDHDHLRNLIYSANLLPGSSSSSAETT